MVILTMTLPYRIFGDSPQQLELSYYWADNPTGRTPPPPHPHFFLDILLNDYQTFKSLYHLDYKRVSINLIEKL